MALEAVVNWKGMRANYWKVISSISNYIKGDTTVTMGLYLNAASRAESTDNVLKTESVTLKGIDFQREKLYPALKGIKQSIWVHAKDV